MTKAGSDGNGAAEAALFAALRAACPRDLAVAVSGGGDSMALLALLAEMPEFRVRAVTVNHGLRPEAAAEAALVAGFCAARGIPHDILTWQHGGQIAGNLMQAARLARRRLIADWAGQVGISHVALAHTAQDQAETLLMGLARAAGLDGLSGMRPSWQENGVTWLRPLLAFGRQELRAVLVRRGITWAEDPTNHDAKYLRARARKALGPLSALGITEATLARSAANLALARGALDRITDQAAHQIVQERAGALCLAPETLPDTDPEILRRLVLRGVSWLNPLPHAPRADRVARLCMALRQGRAATLAGVRLVPAASGLWLCKEDRSLGPMVDAPGQWDGRWTLRGPFQPGDRIGALGTLGLAQIADRKSAGLPRAVLVTTPAVWRHGHLIAAPLARSEPDWCAELGLPFH